MGYFKPIKLFNQFVSQIAIFKSSNHGTKLTGWHKDIHDKQTHKKAKISDTYFGVNTHSHNVLKTDGFFQKEHKLYFRPCRKKLSSAREEMTGYLPSLRLSVSANNK